MGPILCNLFLLPILETWARDTVHLDPVLETEGGEEVSCFISSFADDMANAIGIEGHLRPLIWTFTAHGVPLALPRGGTRLGPS